MASLVIVYVFMAFIAGLAIYGNWLPTSTRVKSFFPAGTTLRDVFGYDVLDYIPSRINARYYELRIQLLTLDASDNDFRILHRYRREALDIYEAALERAIEMARAQRSRQKASRPVERSPATRGWRAVLGLATDEADVAVVKSAFRKRVRKAYPDFGGSHDDAASVIQAYHEAKSELGFV